MRVGLAIILGMLQTAPNETGDTIHIEELELAVRIGVPEEERARPQRLTVSITIWPITHFQEVQDDLAKTVDYSAICHEVKEFVSSRRDRLIETLAEQIAARLLRKFPISRVRLELRKFILSEVKYVAVTLVRERPGLPQND